MLINFSAKNFRSIKEQITLSFEATNDKFLEDYYIINPQKSLRILKMAIIYGANASGKTNVIKALDFLHKMTIFPFDTKKEEFPLEPFKFDSNTPNQPTEFELEFFHKGVRYHYFIKLNRKAVLDEKLYFFNPKKALIYSRTTDIHKQITKIKFGSKIPISKAQNEILEGNTLWNNTVLGGFQKTNIEIKQLKNVLEWFENKLNNIIFPNVPIEVISENFLAFNKIDKRNLINLLRYADFAIEDIQLKKEKLEDEISEIFKKLKFEKLGFVKENNNFFAIENYLIHKVKNKSYKLDIEEESNGTRRYFGLAGFLLKTLKSNNILIIDELESSLHPDLIKHFLLTFLVNSKKAQLIATTHHRELLMERNILRHDVIWFTQRKEDQSTELYSLADFDTSKIRKNSSIYNFYKAGRLGATPNLGSYYLNLNYEKE